MNLNLKRIAIRPEYTIGKLFVENEYFCDTLEDTDRLNNIKIPGKTAIPAGKYKVIMDYSNRFQKWMSHILNVPNFEGIRIHAGNSNVDTEGCILLGENKIKGKVINSAFWCLKFNQKLENSLKKSEVFLNVSRN
jgi:hypothetical protein